MAGWAQVFRFDQRLGDCKVKREPGDTQRHWTCSIGPVQNLGVHVMDTQVLNSWDQFHEIYFAFGEKLLASIYCHGSLFHIQLGEIFPKVMQASGMVCLLQGWQLPSAGVAEAPAATSCYSPQIHWVSVRAKSGEFSPNIQPLTNLSTLRFDEASSNIQVSPTLKQSHCLFLCG